MKRFTRADLRSLLDQATMGARLAWQLPGYLRHPLTLDEARSTLRRRLARREIDFLDLARRAIFARPKCPYLALLRLAGCELGDLERLVAKNGLEGALEALYRCGVYLSLDEFKGRVPVVRGSAVIAVDPSDLRNPLPLPHVWAATSGSRGPSTPFPLDLASLRDRAVNAYLTLDAHGGANWRNAVWGNPGLGPLLWYSLCGGPVARWFTQLDPAAVGLHPRYRWSVRALAWASRFAGVPLPRLEHAPIDAPVAIARWMARTLRAGDVPHLWAFASSAVRLCRLAEQGGIDLVGARFTVTGEPITDARLAVIRGVGAEAIADYGSADSGGSMSAGCLAPEAPDDVHLFHDLNALVQAADPPLPIGALLVSSLRATTPFLLLNVSMGDRAVVSTRRCGCPLEGLGWTTHLDTIRSYEKLTAGGMTFIDTDVIRVLEEVLPREFGGGPTDYQLLEEEAEDGRPIVRLLVHPGVGAIDGAAIARTFLDAIGPGSGAERKMALGWHDGGFLRVDREAPRRTALGKILHLSAPSTRRDVTVGRGEDS